MKTITKIFILGLLLFPVFAFAQQATEQRSYEIRVEWEDMQGYSERVSYNVPIYYDADDNVVKHGPLKINHKHDLTSRVGQKCIIAYNVSGNYVNGKLNGLLSVEKSATVSAGVLKVKGTLNFVNGVPDGTWTFTESAVGGGKTMSAKLAIIIKDKNIVSFNINNGKECFTIDTNNNTFSGTINGEVYKNSVNTSRFIRKTGEITKLDETAQSLINAFVAGTMSESDLIGKGFGFVRSGWIHKYDWENLRYYISKLQVGYFADEKSVSPSISLIIHEAENNRSLSRACTLKRVNVISADDLIAKAGTIKTAYRIDESPEDITWYENSSTWYRYYYNTNQIEINREDWYFTDEAKLKFEEAIKAGLEEKRLEQERIAEEKRLAEIERQNRQIQQICDYLVLQKTSLSICYGEEVGKYFDSTGLNAEYWKLEFEKAIKPFCKIVDCKLVSFENNVAVLDITKFNKKGNITYRVPVTIVNGKILATSIKFAEATIVE